MKGRSWWWCARSFSCQGSLAFLQEFHSCRLCQSLPCPRSTLLHSHWDCSLLALIRCLSAPAFEWALTPLSPSIPETVLVEFAIAVDALAIVDVVVGDTGQRKIRSAGLLGLGYFALESSMSCLRSHWFALLDHSACCSCCHSRDTRRVDFN